MNIHDENGLPIRLSTTKEVYVKSSEGKVVKSYARTFEHFYRTLSDKEIANLWKLAIISLGWDKYPEYQTLLPFNFDFILEEEDVVKPVIWQYFMVAVGYPKSKVMRLNYQAFADTQGLLGFERVLLDKSSAEHEAFDYLLSIRPKERVTGCLYHKLVLNDCKYFILDLDEKKLPILVYANNPEDTNPFFAQNSSQIVINQPKGFLANQFRITEGDLVYDVIYNKPND